MEAKASDDLVGLPGPVRLRVPGGKPRWMSCDTFLILSGPSDVFPDRVIAPRHLLTTCTLLSSSAKLALKALREPLRRIQLR